MIAFGCRGHEAEQPRPEECASVPPVPPFSDSIYVGCEVGGGDETAGTAGTAVCYLLFARGLHYRKLIGTCVSSVSSVPGPSGTLLPQPPQQL